ncbi:Arabinose operon regulatory protein [compost metagenome]
MPITNIGYEAGFKDPSYFARVFKQLLGCTPSEYRSECRPTAMLGAADEGIEEMLSARIHARP